MKSLIVSVVLLLVAIGAGAAEDEFDGIGDWLAPSIHINAAVGESSAEHPEELMAGHHDPTREDGTVQGIELGLSLRTPFHLQGFATYNIAYGYEEEWNDKWEEAFLKLADLPGGFSLRGGRLLARFGLRNNIHLHGWNTVDTPLVPDRRLRRGQRPRPRAWGRGRGSRALACRVLGRRHLLRPRLRPLPEQRLPVLAARHFRGRRR